MNIMQTNNNTTQACKELLTLRVQGSTVSDWSRVSKTDYPEQESTVRVFSNKKNPDLVFTVIHDGFEETLTAHAGVLPGPEPRPGFYNELRAAVADVRYVDYGELWYNTRTHGVAWTCGDGGLPADEKQAREEGEEVTSCEALERMILSVPGVEGEIEYVAEAPPGNLAEGWISLGTCGTESTYFRH